MRIILIATVAGVIATTPALADSIGAERPGFASSPVPLAKDRYQLEAGYQYTEADRIKAHNLPQLVFRTGVADQLEFQAVWSGFTSIDFPGGKADGYSDLTVGLKKRLSASVDSPTQIALYGGLSLPVGDRDFSSDAIDPTIGLFWTHQPDNLPGLFGTLLLSSTTEADNRSLSGGFSVGTGFAIDDRLGSYIELYTLFAEQSGPAHNANGGFTYLLNDDVQLDLEAGVGLNKHADDWFLGLGLAKRW